MNAALKLDAGEWSARIVGREAFALLREPWTHLVQSMSAPTPFATWEWTAAWLETIGANLEPRFVLLEHGAQVRGILPLIRSTARAVPMGPSVLTLCGVESVYPDQLGPIVADQDLTPLLERALPAVWQDQGGWDCVRLPMIAEDSPVFAQLRQLTSSMRLRSKLVTLAPYLPVGGTYDQFLGQLSSNERYKVRNRSKKLLTGQGVVYGEPDTLSSGEALRRLRELHARRAEQKGIHSTFDTEPVQRFHEELLRRMPAERVLFRCLRKESDIFAMFYGFRLAGRIFYFQLGYDPDWSDFSPGLVLLSQTIREAFESGAREYNFLQGDEPFKATWTRRARPLHDWSVFRPGLRGGFYCELGRIREAARSGILAVRAARAAKRNARAGGKRADK